MDTTVTNKDKDELILLCEDSNEVSCWNISTVRLDVIWMYDFNHLTDEVLTVS